MGKMIRKWMIVTVIPEEVLEILVFDNEDLKSLLAEIGAVTTFELLQIYDDMLTKNGIFEKYPSDISTSQKTYFASIHLTGDIPAVWVIGMITRNQWEIFQFSADGLEFTFGFQSGEII